MNRVQDNAAVLGESQEDVVSDFKAAMRRFAVSVSIVTISGETTHSGMTATAVSSVSVQPPSLLVCVNRSTRVHVELQRGRTFCVNFLSHDHSALSGAFGGRLSAEDRFSLGAWAVEDGQPPYLRDAQANLFCTVDATFEYGSHTIFIGRVESVRLSGVLRPLVYADGRYFSIVARESAEGVLPEMDLTWL